MIPELMGSAKVQLVDLLYTKVKHQMKYLIIYLQTKVHLEKLCKKLSSHIKWVITCGSYMDIIIQITT